MSETGELFEHAGHENAHDLQAEVQKIIAESDETILTNEYYNEDEDKHILQLLTHVDGHRYGGESVVRPDMSDIFLREVEIMVDKIEEAVQE